MNLRDTLAGQALIGLLATGRVPPLASGHDEALAARAYALADAMIRRRDSSCNASLHVPHEPISNLE